MRLSCSPKSNIIGYSGVLQREELDGSDTGVCVFYSVVLSPVLTLQVAACLWGSQETSVRRAGLPKFNEYQSGINQLFRFSGPEHSQTHTFQSLTPGRPTWAAVYVWSVELVCGCGSLERP